ncbi:ABC transporter permease [Lentzea sp. NBRC 102530]|uniref:ABC transporter permease n=1 Tax=Lentzea sp. NBRC 102530 TaxID=3032201 RepID=UPI0024A478A5|nr:ABC transporter permease [Lentzea sp. NBRC 102530]GLY46758.1 sugar ABC transporter permease [Lentzea sp. NBRC 102530]
MTTTLTKSGPTPTKAARTKVLQRQGAAVALVLMVAVSWLVFPRFGSLDNLRDLALQGSFLAIIAIGMTFVIITGGIDLSVGSLYALGGVLAAWGSQYGFLAALALPLVVCGLIGLVNGLLIAKTNMAPFIVTLASLLFARGLLLAITDEGANTYKIDGDSAFVELGRGTVAGFGYPIFVAAVLAVLGGMVLNRTNFGQNVFATGGAEQSAVLLGVPVAKTKVLVYTMSGTLAGLAGALTAAYLQSGVTVIGVGLELDAIAVVVIGGTLLTGGMGTILGTVIGVGLIKVIQNVINQIGTLDSNYQSVVSGVFLLVVVVLQRILRR